MNSEKLLASSEFDTRLMSRLLETDFGLEPESTMISSHHRNSKKDMAHQIE